VVVALLDIDALKQTERDIKAARDYAEAVLRTARDPLVVLGADLRVDTANDAFYKTFKVAPDATEGRLIYDLGNRQWDMPKLRRFLEEIIPRNSFFNDYEVTHEFQTIGKRTMLLNARRLDNPEGGAERILLGIDDVTERLESRAALKASELRFRRLFEAAQDGILLLDPISRKITDANPFMAQLLGYTREEFLGKELWQIGLLEDEQAGQAAFRELQNSGYIRYDDLPLQTKDGRAVEVEFVSNLYYEDGHQVIQCNIRDITERKQAEAALRESEERFRRLLETLPVAAYTCDAEGLITYFNERAVEAWGRTPKLNDPVERFCGSYRLYSSDGAQIPHGQCWMALAIKENKVYEAREIVIERPDGSRLTVLAHVSPFYSEAGKLLGAVNIVVDITDRKQAEAVMAQMAAIVESSDDAIVSKDLNGIITSWNKGAQKLFGYTAEEVIGKSITILIPPDRENEESYILDRIRRGEVVDHYETVRRHKDGSEIDVSLTVSPVRDKTGKVIGASKISRDISERKRTEIEREEMLLKETAARAEAESARAEAEAANHSKDEFLAVVSHELRSPLNAILGYNQLLREITPDAARLKSSCDVIERNAKTQLQLIEDLLDSARIASGKLRLELRPLDINPVIADALDMMRPAAEAKGVRLLWAAEEDGSGREESAPPNPQSAIVRGDAARVQQIIWNLLSNAIKFTPSGGRVELRAERAEGHVRIIVSDTGSGIPPEFLPYVFDRFRQADPSGSQRYGGLGLGLALVKHLIELHGGKVEAASEGAGHGSTFILTLPLATQSELVAAEPQALALAAGANGEAQTRGAISLPAGVTIAGLRVLVVDDQEDARALLAEFLGLYGAEVMTASSGAEALAILSNPPGDARPDILICDLAMPMEDGYTALRRMRALEEARGVAASQRIPAVALTALTGNEARLRAIRSGFQAHIAKPADPVELILVIDNIAGIWRRKADSN
jgi:PAS domain S-box-containing protein